MPAHSYLRRGGGIELFIQLPIHRFTVSPDQLPHDENFLRQKLENDPWDWETRRRLAHALYDRDAFGEAAEVIWMADQIPSNDVDLAYAARILSKAQPRKAIRLLAAVLELNRGKAVQNMGMANALLHHGMVLQAARFYGAALEADPTLVNPELEHFILWTDDEMRLWADFSHRRPKLGELPWMARDPMEALRLTSRISFHTTPISVPSLPAVPGEDLQKDLYQQEATRNGKITPPPAVTIPIDRVDPKHRRFDDRFGATVTGRDAPDEPEVIAAAPGPRMLLPGAAAPASPAVAAHSAPLSVAAPLKTAAPLTTPAPMVTPVPLAKSLPGRPPSVFPGEQEAASADAVAVPLAKALPPKPAVVPTVSAVLQPASQVATGGPPAPVVTKSLSPATTQGPTPTRRLLTPGGKPAGMKPPPAVVPLSSPQTAPAAGDGAGGPVAPNQ